MTFEELYGLPDTDYIEKDACTASEEDQQQIDELRAKYEANYRLK